MSFESSLFSSLGARTFKTMILHQQTLTKWREHYTENTVQSTHLVLLRAIENNNILNFIKQHILSSDKILNIINFN